MTTTTTKHIGVTSCPPGQGDPDVYREQWTREKIIKDDCLLFSAFDEQLLWVHHAQSAAQASGGLPDEDGSVPSLLLLQVHVRHPATDPGWPHRQPGPEGCALLPLWGLWCVPLSPKPGSFSGARCFPWSALSVLAHHLVVRWPKLFHVSFCHHMSPLESNVDAIIQYPLVRWIC